MLHYKQEIPAMSRLTRTLQLSRLDQLYQQPSYAGRSCQSQSLAVGRL